MFDSKVKVFGLALLTIASYMVYHSYLSPTTVTAATVATVVTNSDTAYNSAAYYPLTSYGYMRGQVNWPQRWEGCVPAGNGTPYKTFPWLPDNNIPGTSGSPAGYDGNSISTSGNCNDRYSDGGGSSGGWAYPWALGGWAYAGGGGGFGGSQNSYFTSIISCNSLYGGGAPIIWGAGGPDNNDQAYGGGGLMAQNSWSGTVPASGVRAYSNGTTFFRNNFALTTDQYNAISAGSTIRFYGIADDWMQVYLNGNLIGATYYTGQSITIDLSAGYFMPAGSPNVLAIQVSDKTIWSPYGAGSSRGSGLCYNMTADLPVAPPPQWSLSATTTVDKTTVQPGQTINWNHFITNNGPTATNATITAQVHQTVNGVDTSVGSPSYTGAGVASGGNVTWHNSPSYTVTAADMGKTICQYIYWYPNTQDGGSGTSVPKCADVAKQPLVQVWGGDLRVGDGYTTITANSSASINTGVSLTIGANMYGSWGEYGMFAPTSGSIASTSGGVLSGSSGGPAGLSSTQRNPLTFANTPSFGHWGTPNVLPDIANYSFSLLGTPTNSPAADFPVNSASTSGVYNFTAANVKVHGTLSGANILVIKSAGTVEISADLLYGATASYSSFDSIPQIIIIANKIIIDSNVSQVNAWLIAVPNALGSGGSISTCNTIVPSPGHYFDGLTLNDVCSQKQLTVVGPVMAKELQLRRTFGADSINGQATPAEIFNLRADAYAWASSQGDPNTISTTQTIELPPRF